jgi:hypothetical protein
MSNNYEVMLTPGDWKFEAFETWSPKTLWTAACSEPFIHQGFESLNATSDDVGHLNGSYHAIRLAVLESLKKLGRQGTVIVFREVAHEYSLPMGVWHVREAVHHAFNNKPKKYSSPEAALTDISSRLLTPLSEYKQRGVLLSNKWLLEPMKNT